TWLGLHEHRSALLATLDALAGPALAAERAALAALCREPALGRAVALISPDLLRAVDRAAHGADDRRSRKEEPAVLRYALRASTKTSPLSWFTAVGWGPLRAGRAPAGPVPVPDAPVAWGEAGLHEAPFAPVVRVNRALVGALTAALAEDPAHRDALLYRMTSSARTQDGRAAYARVRHLFTGGRHLNTTEEELALPATPPLALLDELAAEPLSLADLTARLDTALRRGGGPAAAERAGGGPAAAYLARLLAAGLLVPAEPVAPQDPAALTSLATWLRSAAPTAGTTAGALADRIEEAAARTRAFAALPSDRRPAALAGLTAHWRALLADAGHPLPDRGGTPRMDVLTEDAVATRPLDLDGFLGAADHQALAELTALAEAFDLGQVMRRIARDRFVARYGPGGTCRHPWEFGADIAAAWEEAGRLTAQDPAAPDGWPAGLAELAALRRAVTESVRARARRTPGAAEVLLPPDLLPGLGRRLPAWIRERPTSYAYFVQRDSTDGLLCVNHVYGGWGRFTSRFLDGMDPAATEAVAARIREGLGPGARAVAVRPVGGFNANLHPLLVPDEIGPDRRWTSLAEPEVELVHDPASDQLRLRLHATGEILDVLYAGFLAPVMLPGRLAAHLSDHPAGVVGLGGLAPAEAVPAPGGQVLRTARLRHRHLVLQRRCWYLDAGTVARLRADLEEQRPLPLTAVARWRALLDLPDQIFLRPAAPGTDPGKFAESFVAGLSRPKPQFVDLGNALHLRNLAKWLTRHTDGAVLEEALPAPGGRDRAAQAVELVVETYREGRPHA
ncbi:lantibiotic dehydratase, partial [Streptomyces sp. WAC06614]|uniref:lantibiotic dehydratase n=1 Tax=Streptomyces sp. WAC06614 TaxID=2487416 RepID=UPI000F7BA7F4